MVISIGHGHRPHDLLWLADPAALVVQESLPRWATPAWLAVSPVVVRRSTIAVPGEGPVGLRGTTLPVGLRGATRSERCAAHVSADRVVRSLTPEAIAHQVATSAVVSASALPCLRTLARVAGALDALPLAWGVTGSVGFTLASGFDVLRFDSDLDLIVRAPSMADADELYAVAALLPDLEARVDVQVETPLGAFALQEWLRTGGPVLLRTNCGPMLVDDAWSGLGVTPAR
jgi:phosphoribosyl-dephospho-CoA transferase